MAPLESFDLRERRNGCKQVIEPELIRPTRVEQPVKVKKSSNETLSVCAVAAVLIAITIATKPAVIATKEPTAAHVWYYGYVLKISDFHFLKNFDGAIEQILICF